VFLPQVLAGDVEEAICTHALFYSIWRKYGALPERFDLVSKSPSVLFYPLRPEFAESTYLLYMATRNPFYLHVGSEILEDLEQHTKARCGYATLHNVIDKSLEDRMESFFLSETCKYLYLLFDHDNVINKMSSEYVFTTEGHLVRLGQLFRKNVNKELGFYHRSRISGSTTFPIAHVNQSRHTCTKIGFGQQYELPLSRSAFRNIESLVGL
jgi:mannosidase alpha-like ER degradation enhancer 1